jgi:hypothetical protein
MSFARTNMQRMTGAGLSCLEILARFALVLMLCVSVAGVACDPCLEVAVIASVDEAADVADGSNPATPDPDGLQIRLASGEAPYLRFDDLCDERLESARNWRVVGCFEARGPPA